MLLIFFPGSFLGYQLLAPWRGMQVAPQQDLYLAHHHGIHHSPQKHHVYRCCIVNYIYVLAEVQGVARATQSFLLLYPLSTSPTP